MSNCPQFGEKRLLLNLGEHFQWQSAVGPQLGIVLAVRRSLQIGPITVRSSLRLPDRPFPARPTQFGDGNRQPGNQRPLNFRIGWQSARRCIRFCTVFLQPMSIEMFYLLLHWSHTWRGGRVAALSDCVYFVDEVLLKSLHSMARCPDAEYLTIVQEGQQGICWKSDILRSGFMDDIVNSVARHFLPFPQSRFYRLCYPQVFPHTVLKCSSVEHHPYPGPFLIHSIVAGCYFHFHLLKI